MIRLRNAVLAAVVGLLATGALAQGFTQDSQAALVAEELFGSGSVKLKFKDFGNEDDAFVPKAKLIFSSPANDAAELGADTEFMVTYTLGNATFAERVSLSDFMWGTWGPMATQGGADCDTGTADDNGADTMRQFCPAGSEVTVTIEDGGARGDDSVTYKVKVNADIEQGAGLVAPLADADPANYTGLTRKIVWAVPDVDATGLLQPYPDHRLPYGRDVTVSTEIERATSAGTAVSEMLIGANTCGSYMPMGVQPTTTVSCPVVEALALVSVSAAGGVNGTNGGRISLNPDDGRAVLVKADGTPETVQRAHIATVTVGAAAGGAFGMMARDENGVVIDGFAGALSGNLAIRVASEGLRDGDMVYIDANTNGMVDGREAFEIDGAVALDTVALAGKGSAMPVYYVPNGKDPMKHRTRFSTTAKTEFGDTNNKERNSGAVPATAQLGLVGIKQDTAKAYAIAPLGSTDVANVRVTCESSSPAGCNVFLDCRDPAGMNTFGEAGATIGPNMTVRWNQMQIAEALELEDGWEGRLVCEVLSSAEITVQVLTRAAGVLVNNTATDSGGT